MSDEKWSADDIDRKVSKCVTAKCGVNVQSQMDQSSRLMVIKQEAMTLTCSEQASGRSIAVQVSDVDALKLRDYIDQHFGK